MSAAVTSDGTARRSPDRSELITGAAAVVGGTAVIPYAMSMPTVGGLPGPGLFPMMVGGLAIFFGVALIVKAVIQARRGTAHRPGADDFAVPDPDAPPVTPAADVEEVGVVHTAMASSTGGRVRNALVVLGAIVFYILAAEPFGFVPTMFVLLAGIMLVLGSRVLVAILTAAGLTALLYAVFELGLLVQLPDGILGW